MDLVVRRLSGYAPQETSYDVALVDATNSKNHRALLVAIIAATLAADQITKYIARAVLHYPHTYLGGLLTLILTQNAGAFLSLGETLPAGVRTLIFSLVVAVGLGVALWALLKGKMQHAGEEAALALVVGGGAGNLVDRLLFHGRVTDFLYMSAGPLHTGVFNVADMAITLAVVWLLLSSFSHREKVPRSGG